jgi:hypothetical protein
LICESARNRETLQQCAPLVASGALRRRLFANAAIAASRVGSLGVERLHENWRQTPHSEHDRQPLPRALYASTQPLIGAWCVRNTWAEPYGSPNAGTTRRARRY